MKQKGIGILAFLAVMSTCLTFGAIGCNKKSADTSTSSSVEDEGRKNPRIMVEADELEFAVEVGERYTMPYAGVYYENLDRVDDAEVRMSLIYSWYDETEGEFVDPYVQIEDTIDNQLILFADAGKYEIVYKSEGCADVVVTIYACEKLPSPTNFQVDLATGTITWDEVEGASGYTVTVNGDTEIDVTEESFTSDIFAQDGFYVGVTAKGDNKIWLDSYLGSYQKRLALGDGELAAFNNPCYELDIKNGSTNVNPAPTEIEWLAEEDCAGSTDGALKVRLRASDYGWSVFNVALQKAIDLPEGSSIEVRFKLDSTDYTSTDENLPTMFVFSGVDKHSNSPKNGIYLNPEHNNEWQILRLDRSKLASYATKSHLNFNLYNMTRGSGKGDLYLDYIRVNTEALATPELTVEEGKLTWAEQENVKEYMVEADVLQEGGARVQKLYYVTANEISLADMGISETSQYDVRVRAVSNVATVGSSDWSEWESKRTLTANYLTKLDSALYEKDADENAVKASNNKQRIYYTASAGADDGSALRVVLRQDYAYNHSHFQLKLTEGIDLAKAADYQGILVRFKVDYVKLDNTSGLRLQYVGKSGNNDTGSLYSKRITETGKWYDLQLPFENLEDLYEDGDKTLYFAVLSDKTQAGMRIAIDIDYVTYYKALTAPTNVRIDKENNKLVWDAVDGASGYTVSVNGDERFVETTEFDLSALTEDALVTVRTESDAEGYAASLESAGFVVHALAGKELATFNNNSYTADVVAGKPNASTSDLLSNGFRPTREPKYDAALGNGGGVDFNLYSGDIGSGKLHAFTVLLYKPLDLTTYDEISVRFAVPSISYNNTMKAYMSLLHATDVTNASYTAAPTANSATAIGFTINEANVKYYTLVLTKAALQSMGYDTGATALTLGVWSEKTTNKGSGLASARIYLDDISYSNVLDIPANVAVSDTGLVTWNTVENADGYIVSVNGEEFAVTTNSYQHADLGLDAIIKVCATSTNTDYDASLWSVEVSYVAPRLDEPTNVTVSDTGLVEWTVVENADKYVISVNGAEYDAATNSYQLTSLTADVIVKVRAVSDGEWMDSEWSAEAYYYALANDELATFNSAAYNVAVVAGNPDCSNSTIATTFNTAPSFDASQGNGGAVFFKTKVSNIGNAKVNIFSVKLAKTLDLTNNDGIEVRIAVPHVHLCQGTNVYLVLGNAGATAGDSYKVASTDETKAIFVPADKSVNFVTIRFTSAELSALGYTNDSDMITFCMWQSVAVNSGAGYCASLWLDDISYYNENNLDTPANVAVSSAGLVTWDEVDGAEGYTVSANGTEYQVTTNSYQLTDLGADAIVKVRATSTDSYWDPSLWSEEVTYEAPRLDIPTNVTVTEEGVITWDEVDGADGYTVSVNGNTVEVEENTYQLTDLTADAVIKVLATTTNTALSNSEWSAEAYYYAPSNTLADFSDVNHGAIGNVDGYGYGSTKDKMYETEPTYADGMGKVGVYFDRYHADGGSTKLAAFTVTVPVGLDLAKGGIVVKVQLTKTSNLGTIALDKFTLLKKDGQKTWQSGTSADFPGTTLTLNEWLEVKISSAEIQAMDYATGDKTLYFGGWIAETVQKHLLHNLQFQLDDISYYEAEGGNDTQNNVLVNFNAETDASKVVAGNPDCANSTITTSFNTAPSFDASQGNGGAVTFKLKASNIGSQKVNIFSVNFDTTLDLTNNDGIEVRIAAPHIHNNLGTNAYLVVGNAGDVAGDSYKVAPTDETKAVAVPEDKSVNFVTIRFTSAELTALGYTNESDMITFCLWQGTATNAAVGYRATVWLDEISYYTEEA